MIEVTIDSIIREACTNIAVAKDRIFLEYLKERGLLHDYENWVGILNEDEARMNRLVFGDR